MGYSPWGPKDLDTTEQLTQYYYYHYFGFIFHLKKSPYIFWLPGSIRETRFHFRTRCKVRPRCTRRRECLWLLSVACRPLGNYGDCTRGATRPTRTCGVARFKALVSHCLASSAEPTQVDPRDHVVAATPRVWLTPRAGGLQPACPLPRDTPARPGLGSSVWIGGCPHPAFPFGLGEAHPWQQRLAGSPRENAPDGRRPTCTL